MPDPDTTNPDHHDLCQHDFIMQMHWSHDRGRPGTAVDRPEVSIRLALAQGSTSQCIVPSYLVI